MTRRAQEVKLQIEIETQEEWEEMLTKEGLTVVDVYQEWCGPCKAMVSNFRRLKNEIGDDYLRFAIAKADTIDALEKYRGKCEPCFLFFAGGKMCALQFGINVPEFSRLVADEVNYIVNEVLTGNAPYKEGSVLVAVVRGANSPTLLKTITTQLAQEHSVLEGKAERIEVEDPLLGRFSDKGQAMADEEEDEEEEQEDAEAIKRIDDLQRSRSNSSASETDYSEGVYLGGEHVMFSAPEAAEEGEIKGFTVAVLKPDLVASGKVNEVIERMKAAGMEILKSREHQFTESEAREFYAHKADEPYFEDLVKFMASGPSHVLVITKGPTGDGIIDEWRQLLGPPSVEQARENAPDSLRAVYGEEGFKNALHGSDSHETAMRELAFFFPGVSMPTISGKTKIQRTLALIRPDAFKLKKDEILAKIHESGFKVAMQKVMVLDRAQAEEFYKDHVGKPYFEDLVTEMTSGPMMALALAREDAVTAWRGMLGPKEIDKAKEEAPESLRAQFAIDGVPINPLHGSKDEDEAKHDLKFFFPVEQTLVAVKPDGYQTKDEIIKKMQEAGLAIMARKETTLTPDVAEEFYRDQKDKSYYNDLIQHMTSGPTLFLILSGEGAVSRVRDIIGPVDPQSAKETAPESIRAQYGTDVKANAVHASSNPKHALENIKVAFPEIEFNADGTPRIQKKTKVKKHEKESSEDKTKEPERVKSPEGKKSPSPPKSPPKTPDGGKKSPVPEPAKSPEPQKNEENTQQEAEQKPPEESDNKAQDDSAKVPETPEKKSYAIMVHTADIEGAGTDSSVTIEIFGNKTSTSEPLKLDNPKNNFERGQVDKFTLELTDFGDLTKVIVKSDNSGMQGDWLLGKIVVEDVATQKTYEFPCNRWLSKDKDDHKSERELLLNIGCQDPPAAGEPELAAAQKKSYEISVYTADIEDAGSDANVSIIITGEKGTMPESVKLDNPKNNFEKGQIDKFTLELDDLGKLTQVVISSDGSGLSSDWFLGKVVVEDHTENKSYEFPCNRWLSKSKDGAKLQRTLLLDTGCTDPPAEEHSQRANSAASNAESNTHKESSRVTDLDSEQNTRRSATPNETNQGNEAVSSRNASRNSERNASRTSERNASRNSGRNSAEARSSKASIKSESNANQQHSSVENSEEAKQNNNNDNDEK